MQLILYYFWQICRLQSGPEHLPRNSFALGATFFSYVLLALTTLLLSEREFAPFEIPVSILLGVVLLGASVYGVLVLKGVGHRFVPAMIALFGTNAVILLITLPLNALRLETAEGPIRDFLEIVFLGIFFWWLAVAGFIVHRSASTSLIQGMVLIFGIELINLLITFSLFPPESQ